MAERLFAGMALGDSGKHNPAYFTFKPVAPTEVRSIERPKWRILWSDKQGRPLTNCLHKATITEIQFQPALWNYFPEGSLIYGYLKQGLDQEDTTEALLRFWWSTFYNNTTDRKLQHKSQETLHSESRLKRPLDEAETLQDQAGEGRSSSTATNNTTDRPKRAKIRSSLNQAQRAKIQISSDQGEQNTGDGNPSSEQIQMTYGQTLLPRSTTHDYILEAYTTRPRSKFSRPEQWTSPRSSAMEREGSSTGTGVLRFGEHQPAGEKRGS